MINLTQHEATPDQVKAGVVDIPDHYREELSDLLTFDSIESTEYVKERSAVIADIFEWAWADIYGHPGRMTAMIGGALWLMGPLARELRKRGVEAYYAFSKRESMDKTEEDGSVTRTMVFKHLGFVQAN